MNVGDANQIATRRQELLLRAAVAKGPAALAAWQAWSRAVDIETDLDHGSFRLLPLLYVNLQQMGVVDPLMGRLKGIYRQAWSKNQTLFHDLAIVVERLQAAGIKTMLLKGAPLSLLYYKNNGARPMADIDLLVPHAQARPAYDLLVAAGWTPTPTLNEGLLNYDHSLHFTNASGRELDLHWCLFHGCCHGDETDFWATAAPVRMAGVATLAPGPTEMLFHTVVHGMAWNPEPPIRWVADAMTLIQSPDAAIDWTRLIQLAERHRVGLRLKNGLAYLGAAFPAAVPPAVMDALNHLPVRYLEKMEYRFLMTPQDVRKRRSYGTFCYHLAVYRRLTSHGRRRVVGGFAGYLKWVMHTGSAAGLFCRLLHRGIRVTTSGLLNRRDGKTLV